MSDQSLKAVLSVESEIIERRVAMERRDFTATEAARLCELSREIDRIDAHAEADDGWNVE